MSDLKRTNAVTDRENGNFGMLANGSSGQWEIAIDETTTGKDRWFAQLEGPSAYLNFEISSPHIAEGIIDYLSDANSQSESHNGALLIGGDKRVPVSLVRDDEFADRVFLVVGPDSAPIVRFTISGTDIHDLVEAFRQVKEDLED
jgi:hypothetical protein